MNEQQDKQQDEQKDEQKDGQPLPMLIAHGEGYVTRKDGTIVPFTLSTEEK